jgi:hypothetical protein
MSTSPPDLRPPDHQHVWELVDVDGNDGPARNGMACACGEVQPD